MLQLTFLQGRLRLDKSSIFPGSWVLFNAGVEAVTWVVSEVVDNAEALAALLLGFSTSFLKSYLTIEIIISASASLLLYKFFCPYYSLVTIFSYHFD